MSFSRLNPPPSSTTWWEETPEQVTKQEFRSECDINNIMGKYIGQGIMPAPWSNPPVARYGDFSEAADYHTAQNIILMARQRFESLPSRLRERFGNDPAQLLAFLDDQANRPEAEKLGLVAPPPSAPPATPSASPPAATK